MYTRIVGLSFLTLSVCVLAYFWGMREARLIDAGLREEWVEMPVPNSAEYKISSVGWHSVYVELEEQIFECSDYKTTCEPTTIPLFSLATEQCDFEHIAFSAPSRPKTMNKCYYNELTAVDSWTQAFAIVDARGRLWMWSHTLGGFNPFEFILNLPNLYVCFSILILIPTWVIVLASQPAFWKRAKQTFPRYFQQ